MLSVSRPKHSMIKLYKRLEDGALAYHEAWVDGEHVVEHWGRVGTEGERRDRPLASSDADEALESVLEVARARGFEEIDSDDHRRLIVEYLVDGMGGSGDLDKRHRLEEKLNELLGWTGLGDCDGGSIGSDTMEVCCFVVDFPIAKAVVARALAGSEYGDYKRIYNEDEDVAGAG